MKILSVIGTRPQFVKSAATSLAVQKLRQQGADLSETTVHTGQHYDENMSRVFFDELGMPDPAFRLEAGSGRHGVQTGKMLAELEAVMVEEKPDVVVVFGDCNTTLAGALAAKKLHRPLAHIESGLRSYNREMPEKINRLATDSISDILFCPTQLSFDNLVREGNRERSVLVGDVMYDAHRIFSDVAKARSSILETTGVAGKEFALATIHRASNTEHPEQLGAIVAALVMIAEEMEVILPMHPRTRAAIEKHGLNIGGINLIPPVGYLDMLRLEAEAHLILTDSGGVQKEAFFSETPCLTLREETEWVETVDTGWNLLVGSDRQMIMSGWRRLKETPPSHLVGNPYGDGDAGSKMIETLLDRYGKAQNRRPGNEC